MANPGTPGKTVVRIGREASYGVGGTTMTEKSEVISVDIAPQQNMFDDPSLYDAVSPRSILRASLFHRGTMRFRANYDGSILPRLLYGVLGSSAKAGSAQYTYTLKEGATLPSHAIEVCQADVATGRYVVYNGLSVEQLTIRGSAGTGADGMLQVEANVHAKAALVDQVGVGTVSTFPTVNPIYFSQASDVDDGVAADVPAKTDIRLKSFELSIRNSLDTERFFFGSASPDQPLRNGLYEVTLQLEEEFKTQAAFNAALAASEPISTGGRSAGLKFEGATIGASKYTLSFYMKSAKIDDYRLTIDGYGIPRCSLRWKGYYNASDLSALVATVINQDNLTL
jgi:hypothetical protein